MDPRNSNPVKYSPRLAYTCPHSKIVLMDPNHETSLELDHPTDSEIITSLIIVKLNSVKSTCLVPGYPLTEPG